MLDNDRGCAPEPPPGAGGSGDGQSPGRCSKNVPMKLQFDKSGRRFFFLTFALRGRPQALSRIVEKPGRDGAPGWATALLPPGEAIAALWRGIHGRWPFLTASNFCIMPDHVHLLLIADYARAPQFDVLDWFQHFRREGEEAVAPLLGVKPAYVWEDHFWLMLLNAGVALSAVRKYIRMNPARRVWKEQHPDRFVRMRGIRHPSLDPALPWTAIGDLTLLASPFLFPVRLTRRLTVEQHGPEIERMVGLARLGWLPVCGFLSPGEKELERRLRAEPYARWIKTVAHGLPPRFDPTVEDSRFLAEGRQLFLSSFPDDMPVFPVNYDNCHLMNARTEALCARAAAGEAAP